MNEFLLRWRSRWSGTSRGYAVLAFLLLLIGAAQAIEWAVLRHADQNFEAVVDERCAGYLQTAVQSFADIQRSTRRVATETAGQSSVIEYLARRDTSRAAIFPSVVNLARDQDVGIEVYDRNGSLICWEGRSGARHPREVRLALDGQMTSYVTMTPIASQLFVTIPVRAERSILGAVMVRRTIDVNYPLNNRYIRREGLTTTLTHLLGVTIDFDFAPDAQPRKDGRYASAVLFGIDSSRVGVVNVLRPPRAAFLDSLALPFDNATTLFVVAAILVLGFLLWRLFDRPGVSPAIRIPGVLGIIWGVRFALLFLDVGSIVPIGSLFNPALFASQFGGGVARSLGDMTLSVAALALSLWYVCFHAKPFGSPAPLGQRSLPEMLLRIIGALLIGFFLLWLLRGFGAIARGVVFDSTIHLNDPREVFPGLELSVMMGDVLAAAVCLVVVGAAGVWMMLRLMFNRLTYYRRDWVLMLGVLLVFSWVFGQIQETPLMDTVHRVLYACLIVGAAWVAVKQRSQGKKILTVRSASALLFGAALLYYPLIDLNIRDKDRDRVESFAREAIRPIDSWLSLVVDDGLDGLSNNDAVESIVDGDSVSVDRLAFIRWAQSLACREGYASLFELTDTTGTPISRFAIGSQIQGALESDTLFTPVRKRVVAVREIGSGITALHVYYGTSPVTGFKGELLGYAKVLVAAGPQSLFRGENPGVLRPAGPEGLRSFYRPVTVSEYHDGVIFSSNNPNVPFRRPMPAAIDTLLATMPAVWTDETIGGDSYESYYIRRPGSNSDVVALSVQDPGVEWHLVGLVRLFGFCGAIVLAGIVIAFGIRSFVGRSFALTFRGRLLGALLVTAVIPLAVSTIYSRYYARERHMAATSTRLSDYTLAIAQNIPTQPDSLMHFAPEGAAVGAEQLAADVGTDFNIYEGDRLVITSRPELFDAGILDRRMNGDAFFQSYVIGNRFFVENERIGVYEYAVGYRPVMSDDGVVEAVIAVPMLYRMDELNEEVAGRNAFLFAVYFVVFAGLIGLAALFAGRIAAPIQALTEATGRIAKGDLNVDLGHFAEEGEIGDLIRSFERMAVELKESRENLVRAERELAWKEMARQVAHEIKNPLTPMRLAVQHMRMVYREGAEGFREVFEEVTRTLLHQIDALSRIASEFSHFGRMPRPQHVPCNINDVVKESVALFEQEVGLTFEVGLEEPLPEILADPEELRRAFINVLRNAVQAMNSTGRITVTSRLKEQIAEVTFQDSGPGIPDDVKPKLFQPNFSTKTEGMGLGLAIVKKTIDDLHGTIEITSEPRRGTSVIIRIPVKRDEEIGGNGEPA